MINYIIKVSIDATEKKQKHTYQCLQHLGRHEKNMIFGLNLDRIKKKKLSKKTRETVRK